MIKIMTTKNITEERQSDRREVESEKEGGTERIYKTRVG